MHSTGTNGVDDKTSTATHSHQPNGGAPQSTTRIGKFKDWMIQWRGSRRLVLVIVAIALLLDNMLLTIVGKCI